MSAGGGALLHIKERANFFAKVSLYLQNVKDKGTDETKTFPSLDITFGLML